MRSFIAIEIPGNVKDVIKGVIRKLEGDSRGVRWVPVENIHLTLKFLGEVDDGLAAELKQRLEQIGRNHRPFTVDVRGAGAFPNYRNPNVLWIGISRSELLEGLFGKIDLSLSEMGFEKEGRGFSPHLTIGRVKDRRGMDSITKELSTYNDTFFGTIEVREILLMKSVLKPSGAEYSKVAVIRLNADK